MTQVTLEHREPIVYGPIVIQFTKFDTDDERFKNEADELGLKWRREYEDDRLEARKMDVNISERKKNGLSNV